ncbi:unnamed protein product [Penicillium olsonii]|nr:unnamed protein product [Penicillium olsonii]
MLNMCNNSTLDMTPYHSVGDIISYTEDLVGLLSSCLRQFPNLKALDFSGPPLKSLIHDKMKASIDPIIMALCYVPLPNLRELEIQSTMTNDFAPFFAEITSILRTRLNRPSIVFIILNCASIAQTNQQSYTTYLLRTVELSTSLTSLSLSSTDYLSIDHLNLGSTVRLRILFLHKVKFSSRNLVKIIEQCSESMQHIESRHVKLEAGTRSEVLFACIVYRTYVTL